MAHPLLMLFWKLLLSISHWGYMKIITSICDLCSNYPDDTHTSIRISFSLYEIIFIQRQNAQYFLQSNLLITSILWFSKELWKQWENISKIFSHFFFGWVLVDFTKFYFIMEIFIGSKKNFFVRKKKRDAFELFINWLRFKYRFCAQLFKWSFLGWKIFVKKTQSSFRLFLD